MHRRLAPLVLVAALLLAGCSGPGGSVAATVDGEGIPASAVEKRVRAQLASPPGQGGAPAQQAERTSQLQNQVLSQLIILTIVEQGLPGVLRLHLKDL